MTSWVKKRLKIDPKKIPAQAAGAADDRFKAAPIARWFLNKVFPDHWSFLLGELALYSFIMLLLTGTFLALFFEPSSQEVHYDGSYTPLRGVPMSAAYASTLNISFDVRGGLMIRQMHHWSALLFMAAMVMHLFRHFFSGSFRKPRETTWMIGVLLFWLSFLQGFTGYSLPDDGLSGTGLRIGYAIVLSIPLIGTWAAFALFGGEFPGTEIIYRFYILHVFLIPLTLLALITVHIGLTFWQKHTQWPGPRRTEHNVVGARFFPRFMASGAGWSMFVFAMIALLGGLVQINPIWLFGPYQSAAVTTAAQPDWYVMFMDGMVRLFPAWEIRLFGFTIPPILWPAVVMPGLLTAGPMLYPFIEARIRKDKGHHNLLERPRDVPVRTGLGAAFITFALICVLSGGNDVIAEKFDISLNAMTWAGRIGVFIGPMIVYYVTHRFCLGLQQHDREVLAHGVETGIIKRQPSGQYVEVHQPLAAPDAHGHVELEYGGAPVPKKMNRLGVLGPAQKGFFTEVEDGADGGNGARRAADAIESESAVHRS